MMAQFPNIRSALQIGEVFRRLFHAHSGDGHFPRYIRKHANNPKWEGPYYFLAKHWRRDLLLVLEQMRLNVQTNVPLSPAFGAAAEDYLAYDKGWSPQRSTRFFTLTALAVMVFLTLAGAVAGLADEGPEDLHRLLQPSVFGIWLILAARHQSYKPAAVFAALQARINAGNSLSEAMGKLPRFFPLDLVKLVAMAEKTGNLESVLAGFSEETVRMCTAQRDVARVLRYVGIVLLVQAGIIAFMVVKVFPVFETVLEEVEPGLAARQSISATPIPLPNMVQIFEVANFLKVHRYHVFGIVWLGGFWIWIRPRRKRRNWASRVESTVLLVIPGLRGLVVRQNLSSIAFMLRQLLAAGVPMEQALETIADSDLHPLYRRRMKRARQRILHGFTLKEALSGSGFLAPVPRSYLAMIGMGEAHGRLDSALAYMTDQYQMKVERGKKLLISAIVPLGVFVTGYLVLSVEASMFQAMANLADAIMP